MPTEIEGSTFFMRCGVCHTMYRPEDALSFNGNVGPAWFRPKTIRKPAVCDHPRNNIEMWADGAWHSLPYEKEKA